MDDSETFAVKAQALRGGHSAYVFGLTRAQIEQTVVWPWEHDATVYVDGAAFEPGTYRVEIRPCQVVPAGGSPARAWAAIRARPVTENFLRRRRARISLKRTGAAFATLVAVGGGVVAILGYVQSQRHATPWNERAEAACVLLFDRLNADGQSGSDKNVATAIWQDHVREYLELRKIDPPASMQLTWRLLVKATEDLVEIWGKAANVVGELPNGTLTYYSSAIDADLAEIRKAGRRLGLRECGTVDTNKLVRGFADVLSGK